MIYYSMYIISCLSLIKYQRSTEGERNVPPPWTFWVFAVLNFDCTTCIYFNLSQHTITYNVYNIYFTLCSHYKTIGYVWKGNKTIPRPQEFYRAPVLKFLYPSLKLTCTNWQIPFISYDNGMFLTTVAKYQVQVSCGHVHVYIDNKC